MEFLDGRVVREEILELDPGMISIGVRRPEPQGIKRVALDTIRSIKLTRPLEYVPDVAALDALGAADTPVDQHKSFVVSLADGSTMTGRTLGFIRTRAGLFLFLVEGDAARAFNCFIPAGQIRQLQIGPLLGDMLVENHAVSAEELELALNKQAKLRQERIGNYLIDRAIISAEDLTRALETQGKRPDCPPRRNSRRGGTDHPGAARRKR